jgi:hypothetical protein
MILCLFGNWLKFCAAPVQNNIILENLWLKKKVGQQIFSPSSFVIVVGSEIRDRGHKNQDPGSRINIPDPQH